jgi:hypothetical protein
VFAPAHAYTVGTYPWRMALGDIDGDGAPDLVIADGGDSRVSTLHQGAAVWMLRQDPANPGTFLRPQQLATNMTAPFDVAIGDVNGDGLPDIVATSDYNSDNYAELFLQDASLRGTFQTQELMLPGSATLVAIGDLNKDGRNDLAFRMYLSSTNYVWSTALGIVYQQPGGGFGAVNQVSLQTGLNSQMLSITQYDTNGLPDIVEFFTPGSAGYQTKVTTLLQNPLGSFVSTDTSLAGIQGVDDGVVADLNGDGRPDFAMVGTYPCGSSPLSTPNICSTLTTFMQNGNGGFAQASSISMPIPATRIAAGDINGDGLNDLVVLGDKNQVAVLLQSNAVHGTFLTPHILQ